MKILLISNTKGTWVEQDVEILKELGHKTKVSITEATFGPWRILKMFFKAVLPALWADVIFCWFSFPAGFVGAFLSKIFGKKVIVNAVGVDVAQVPEINYGASLKWYWKKVIGWTLRNSDKVIAISKEIARSAESLGAKDVEVIYEAIDIEKFRLINIEEPEEEQIILSVGILSKPNVKRKGFDTIIKSAPYVIQKNEKNVKFVFVGKKKDGYPLLKNLAEQLGVSNFVEFKGYVPKENLILVYNQCALFTLPSLHEGFATVCCEAMACGRPVVTTNVTAMPEVVVNGKTGLLVELSSPNKLAEAITLLLQNSDLRERMGREARRHIVQNFGRKIRSERLENLLEKVFESENQSGQE